MSAKAFAEEEEGRGGEEEQEEQEERGKEHSTNPNGLSTCLSESGN